MKATITKLFIGISMVFASGCGLMKYWQHREVQRHLLSVVHSGPDGFCASSGTELSLSPLGRYAILQTGQRPQSNVIAEGRSISLLDLDCLMRATPAASEQCAVGVSSPNGVRVMGWSGSDRSLYLVEGRKRLVRLTSDNDFRPSSDIAPLSQLVASKALRAIPTVDRPAREEAGDLESIASIQPQGVATEDVSGIYVGTGSESTGWVIEDGASLGLHVIHKGVDVDTNRMFREVPDTRVVSSPTGSLIVAGFGTWITVADTSAGRRYADLQPRLPFSRPIFSSRTGHHLGFFNRESIQLSDDISLGGLEGLKGKGSLKAVAIGSDSQVAILAGIGLPKQVHVARRGHSRVLSCAPLAGASGLSDVVSVHYRELGTDDRPLYAVEYSRSDSKGLVVFFSGGPLNTADDDVYSVRQYLKAGWSVLAVNYSGSRGNGSQVSGRIRHAGLQLAAHEDALQVSQFLSMRKSTRVVIHGESFGALGAIALTNVMANEGSIADLILVAPFLKHQDPTQWIPGDAEQQMLSGAVDASFQRKFEGVLFDKAFDDEQTSLVKSKTPRVRTLAIFAALDRMSTTDHIPRSWLADSLPINTVPGNHALVSAMPDTWKSISSWLHHH